MTTVTARQLSLDALAGAGYEVEGVKDGAAGWEALAGEELRPHHHR